MTPDALTPDALTPDAVSTPGSPAADVPAALSAEGLPACRAHGVDRYHHAARADLSFGAGSWIAILNGASGTPREITFTCSGCGEAFEVTRDPAVLREFRRYPYVDRKARP